MTPYYAARDAMRVCETTAATLSDTWRAVEFACVNRCQDMRHIFPRVRTYEETCQAIGAIHMAVRR